MQSSLSSQARPSTQFLSKNEAGQVEKEDACMNCGNSVHKRNRPPQKPTGMQSFQSGTVASRSKSVGQKRRSLSVESSRSVQSTRSNRASTGARTQQSSNNNAGRGSSLTRARPGSGFGSVQGMGSRCKMQCLQPSLSDCLRHEYLCGFCFRGVHKRSHDRSHTYFCPLATW